MLFVKSSLETLMYKGFLEVLIFLLKSSVSLWINFDCVVIKNSQVL